MMGEHEPPTAYEPEAILQARMLAYKWALGIIGTLLATAVTMQVGVLSNIASKADLEIVRQEMIERVKNVPYTKHQSLITQTLAAHTRAIEELVKSQSGTKAEMAAISAKIDVLLKGK